MGEGDVVGHPVELPALRADGSAFPAEIAIRRLETPGPPVFTGFIRDLTERHESERELRALGEEQAALRRVATLVASSADQARVFDAVTEEVGRLLGAQTRQHGPLPARCDRARDRRVERARDARRPARDDGSARGRHGRPADLPDRQAGARRQLRRRARRARRSLRELGFDAAVGAPVVLDGELWGAVLVRSAHGPVPARRRVPAAGVRRAGRAGARQRRGAQQQLAASRARIVAAGDAERRRLERNLHDGAQQRLVVAGAALRLAQRAARDERRGCTARDRRGVRGARARARRAARARARPAPGDPHRSRPRGGACTRWPAALPSRRCRACGSTQRAAGERSRRPPTTSSPRR